MDEDVGDWEGGQWCACRLSIVRRASKVVGGVKWCGGAMVAGGVMGTLGRGCGRGGAERGGTRNGNGSETGAGAATRTEAERS